MYQEQTYQIMQEQLDNHLISHKAFIAVANINPDDPEYAHQRMNGFGASDAAALLDVSKYGTKADLILDKIKKNTHPEISKIASVRKGKELEPVLITKTEGYLDLPILKPKHMYGLDNGLRVNFDGVIIEDKDVFIPVEIKLCTYWGRKQYEFDKSLGQEHETTTLPERTQFPGKIFTKEDMKYNAEHLGIPVNYYCQIQQQMLFLGSPYGYLAVMDDNNWNMYYFKIPRDQDLIDVLYQTADVEFKLLRMKRGEKIEVGDYDI